jgi:hypothetical protein
MASRTVVTTIAVLVAVGAAVIWYTSGPRQAEAPSSTDSTPAISTPTSSTAVKFSSVSIGDPIKGDERPQIAHVAVADIDDDGLDDVIVADAKRNIVSWIRRAPDGTFAERSLGGVAAPAHTQPIDFDGDGDTDLVVAALGFLFPNNNRVGSVIVLENDGNETFTHRYVADRIARAADARAADMDMDGDLDIVVAGFGYDDGETSWLENKGGWAFEQHVLQRLSGAINAIPVDLNRDGALDIVSLVSQEWEEIWAFVNDGGGRFTPRMLWGSTNPDFGSSWLSMADMDRDGDQDLLYANGDAFEYAPPNSRPWQGIQWLENRGDFAFKLHRLVDLQGATSPEAADVDADGDLDVVIVTANNDWDSPQAASLLWLRNDGGMRFSAHNLASSPTHLLTAAIGDLDGDTRPDVVTGGMHISRPFDRMGRITAWLTKGPTQ